MSPPQNNEYPTGQLRFYMVTDRKLTGVVVGDGLFVCSIIDLG